METGDEIITPAHRFLPIFFRLAVGIVILAAILSLVDIRRVIGAFSSADIPLLLLGVALSVANIGTQIAKWKYLLSLVHPQISWKVAAMSVLFGNSLGVVTPGHLGEFVGRALRVKHQSPMLIAGMAVLDRFQNLMIFTIGALLALPVYSFFSGLTAAIIAAVFVLVLVVVGLTVGQRGKTGFNLNRIRWFSDAMETVRLMGMRRWITSMALSVAFYAVIQVQMFAFLNAFQPTSFSDALAGFAMTLFVKSFLPFSFGDLGIREASSVYFYSLLGVAAPGAFNAAFMMFVVNILLPSIVGVLFTPGVSVSANAQKSVSKAP